MSAEGRRVLVVEDTFSNVVLLQAKLSEKQYLVTVAANGLDALEMIEDHAFDIVLLDVMLPGIDGFEVCRRIRAHRKGVDLPIIMLTALDTDADRATGLGAGADDYFLKPVEDDILFPRMQALIARPRRPLTAESARA